MCSTVHKPIDFFQNKNPKIYETNWNSNKISKGIFKHLKNPEFPLKNTRKHNVLLFSVPIQSKYRKRLHFHGYDLKSLQKYIHSSVLPKEFDGELELSLDDPVNDDIFNLFNSYEQRFLGNNAEIKNLLLLNIIDIICSFLQMSLNLVIIPDVNRDIE